MDDEWKGVPRNSEISLSCVVISTCARFLLRHEQSRAGRDRRTVKGLADADTQLLLRGIEWEELSGRKA